MFSDVDPTPSQFHVTSQDREMGKFMVHIESYGYSLFAIPDSKPFSSVWVAVQPGLHHRRCQTVQGL